MAAVLPVWPPRSSPGEKQPGWKPRTKWDTATYWWQEASKDLVNEDAPMAPANPFKVAYWKQFGGPGPYKVPPPKK
jgi:hypothetical protein